MGRKAEAGRRSPRAKAGRRGGGGVLWAGVAGGVVAAVVSTVAQIVLWLLFTDGFPAILWRDARLTAAIVLGTGVLPPPASADWPVLVVATIIHFALSLSYGIAFCALTHRLGWPAAIGAGAVLGLALYLVNLHGLTAVFPWFAAARGAITVVAHLVFGVSATATCQLILRRRTTT